MFEDFRDNICCAYILPFICSTGRQLKGKAKHTKLNQVSGKHGRGFQNEDTFSKRMFEGESMQSFAWTIAKLCVGDCKALRWQMQCFALADAMLCVGRCNALRGQMQCFAWADAMLCV